VAPATAAALTRYLDADTGVGPDHVDLAIVFGSESLQAPLMAADVVRAGQADWVLLTGGRSRHTGVEEAGRNLSVIEAEGLPTDRIVLEETSTTTTENVVLSLPLLDERFAGDGPRTVLVVAKWHHTRRAVMTLRRHLPAGVRYSVFGYDPGHGTRPGWSRSAEGRRIVLGEWRKIGAYRREGLIADIRRDGDAWV
jgi:microcompartment protein CcmK/EutM